VPTIRIHLDRLLNDTGLQLGGELIAIREHVRSPVTLGREVTIEQGGFALPDGTRSGKKLNWTPGTTLLFQYESRIDVRIWMAFVEREFPGAVELIELAAADKAPGASPR
jgi:hypothetical protein